MSKTQMGDLEEIPPSTQPIGLPALIKKAEGVIQKQIELLAAGTPSKAPDLKQLLKNGGVAKPEEQSTMIDQYDTNKTSIQNATTDIHGSDDGVSIDTTNVGDLITGAYGAIETAVGKLNGIIRTARDRIRTQKDKDGNPVKDSQGNEVKELPPDQVKAVFDGIWEALGTTYSKVHGISDEAAAAALKITNGSPYRSPVADNPVPLSYGGSAYSGSTPWTAEGGSSDVIVSTSDKPTALAMMKYLMDPNNFNPPFTAAQAAGIVANAKFESGFSVSATGDNGTAKGIFQWRFGRQDALRAFASQPGESLGDWRTHLDYMAKELRGGSYDAANNAVNANKTDAGQVAADFDHLYEKSSGSTTASRRAYANKLLQEWNSSQASMSA
ncbi:MAG: hypothetical protein HOQ24_10560 [Mycobacteriaceae bacterium]|nr:hypothetical protein [Mycobacteriaceae bacterium]